MTKPLEGIKIIECSHVITGPFCGMLLGDLGADIIKIEQPGVGEYARNGGYKTENNTSLWFPNYNRNKRDLTLNLKTEKGKNIFKDLIKESDILIENFRPGLLNELGLGYEVLKEINPQLIMISISGYGQTGPKSRKTAFDMTVLADSGLMSLTGEEGGIPMKMGTAISDFLAGVYGALGALVSIINRNKTGLGQYVDVSMLDCLLSIYETSISEYTVLGMKPVRPGNRRASSAPSNIFLAKDGYVYIAAFFQNHFEKLFKILDCEHYIYDERFKTGNSRKENEKILEEVIESWVKDKTVEEVNEILEEQNIPCAPIREVEQVVDEYKDSIMSFDYPGIGEFKVAKFPIKFSTINTDLTKRPPTLGEHNKEIICDFLGYSEEVYEELIKHGVI